MKKTQAVLVCTLASFLFVACKPSPDCVYASTDTHTNIIDLGGLQCQAQKECAEAAGAEAPDCDAEFDVPACNKEYTDLDKCIAATAECVDGKAIFDFGNCEDKADTFDACWSETGCSSYTDGENPQTLGL